MMTLRHIRVGVIRSGRRIGTHGNRAGSPGRTLCGGEFTAQDWTFGDARRANSIEIRQFNVCPACVAKINAEEVRIEESL